ncbi:hypothetical protein J6590_102120 [Homalodisca vitripennis]|nr:hypothetical protein J6590_102120 [Homalodisca vitripennis]
MHIKDDLTSSIISHIRACPPLPGLTKEAGSELASPSSEEIWLGLIPKFVLMDLEDSLNPHSYPSRIFCLSGPAQRTFQD